jgi:hypothetical protein
MLAEIVERVALRLAPGTVPAEPTSFAMENAWRAMTRARCGRAIGLPLRLIASWKPPAMWSAPSFHHSGSATSNSQRLSAADALLATSIMPAAPVGKGPMVIAAQ